MRLVATYSTALRCIPRKWRGNLKIVAKAMQENGQAIKWASKDLRNHDDLAMAAAVQNPGGEFLQHVSARLRRCPALNLIAAGTQGSAIKFMDKVHLSNREIIFAASLSYPALPLADVTLLEDEVFVAAVWRRCRAALVGPNLMPFVENADLLRRVAIEVAYQDIFLCRIRLLSGRATLTSFDRSTLTCCDCLGLDTLFPDADRFLNGQTECRGKLSDFAGWEARLFNPLDLGLEMGSLNDVMLVLY